ncbi:hypothetical protein R4J09_12470 [Brachyspira intermedia]|uniref:hypothetical protein n=1 Tax=Brachyspira intermedia TaxID=84377 RepID=UPI003003DA5D
MNKKLLTIFLSLFLVGILSVSCSNKDKTAPDTSTPKTIDPKYSGIWSSSDNPDAVEIDINGNIYEYNSTRGNKGEVLESTDPSYKVKIYGSEITITFKDVNNATVNIDGQNVTYSKTSKGIEQFNNNSYVSGDIGGGNYLWVSIKNGKVGIMGANNNTSEPSYLGYMNVTGYATDYNFYSSIGDAEGTLKFSSDGSSLTVRFTKNDNAPSSVDQDFVCNKKQ